MEHCCKEMSHWASYQCDQHADPAVCPDNIISYSQKKRSYGIRVHDGGTASIAIAFCPWCGGNLSAQAAHRT
jgi:hypothetical protein